MNDEAFLFFQPDDGYPSYSMEKKPIPTLDEALKRYRQCECHMGEIMPCPICKGYDENS